MPSVRRIVRGTKAGAEAPDTLPYGVSGIREYVGGMSIELAKMARADGDEKLACLLEVAADFARRDFVDPA